VEVRALCAEVFWVATFVPGIDALRETCFKTLVAKFAAG
jgi:hypothetical protein